jgi:hypothetical protein
VLPRQLEKILATISEKNSWPVELHDTLHTTHDTLHTTHDTRQGRCCVPEQFIDPPRHGEDLCELLVKVGQLSAQPQPAPLGKLQFCALPSERVERHRQPNPENRKVGAGQRRRLFTCLTTGRKCIEIVLQLLLAEPLHELFPVC